MEMHPDAQPFAQAIAEDLAGPLPGEKAQDVMAPRPRSYAEHHSGPVMNAKVNGVLILLYMRGDEVYFPLILRATYPGVHSGQVSLPGGRIEDVDGGIVDCALREAEEEIGIDAQKVEVLGRLSPLYIGASNNIVYPVVGWMCEYPTFRIDEREVAMLIEAPLGSLLNPENIHAEWRNVRDRRAYVPYFRLDHQIVWGATAMILGELVELPAIKRYRPRL